jgi:exodeoxyribonuclease V alpha subunit
MQNLAASQFTAFMLKLDETNNPAVAEAATVLIEQVQQGRIAIPVKEIDDSPAWLEKLMQSRVVGLADEFTPMIVDSGHIYIHRYWDYQKRLLNEINTRTQFTSVLTDSQSLHQTLNELFPPDREETDWQKFAAASALLKPFLIISGGPGTGKTTTVTKILKLLVQKHYQNHDYEPRIILAAPTGKAAMRMQESIRDAADEALNTLLDDASTIHRVLGYIPNQINFRHNKQNPLSTDIVIIDEASMIDLALFTKLIEAIPEQAHLILLGDKDQLASVETGSVFNDLCANADNPFSENRIKQILNLDNDSTSPSINEHIVVLQKSYRFTADSGIGHLAKAVNNKDAQTSLNLLTDESYPDIQQVAVSALKTHFQQYHLHPWQGYFNAVKNKADLDEIYQAFLQFRILTALRMGSTGSETINQHIEQHLQRQFFKGQSPWYEGRPIMITQNNYQTGLFNGDIGIMLEDQQGDLKTWFQTLDGNWQSYPISRLPAHETAWAMTIHKSQGSEFEHVLMILPDAETPVLNRELIYTGLTRAKSSLKLATSAETLVTGLKQQQMQSTAIQSIIHKPPHNPSHQTG